MPINWGYEIISNRAEFDAVSLQVDTTYLDGNIELPPSYPCLLELTRSSDGDVIAYEYVEVCDIEPGVEQTHYLDEDPAYVELMEAAIEMYMNRYE